MRVFLSAGEASGDAYAAAFVEQFRKLVPVAEFEGGGGVLMRSAGAQLIADTASWGAIGIYQALRNVPYVLNGYYRLKRALGKGRPGLFVPIDFGYANIRLARHAKRLGWKVLYLVPPASWRRDRQGADLPMVTDAIVTPFSWSADLLRGMGANAHFFGHPIKQLLGSEPRVAGEGVAVLPGSRGHEIAENLPVIAAALKNYAGKVVFGLAPHVDERRLLASWRELSQRQGDVAVLGAVAALRQCRAAIVCSGTATLEAALCRRPMVIVYRVSRAMVAEAKIIGFKRPKFIALPNILLDRLVAPELVQDEATPSAIRSMVDDLLADSPARTAQLQAFDELDEMLGPADAITRAAKLGADLMNQTPQS